MKIVVISDTHMHEHSEYLPLKLLEEIKGADMLVHAGDFVNSALLTELKSLCSNMHAVWGNMDPQDVRARLPEKDIFKVGKYKIGLVHGCGAPNQMRGLLIQIFKDDKLDIIIFGHAHVSCNETIGDVLFFNPGSPTDKVFASVNSYGIIEINDKLQARIVNL